MNESAEYTRLLAQAYSKLADDYSAIRKREDAARAKIQRLEELLKKWALHAARESERADAAEARVKELEADNTRGAAYVQHLKEQLTARKQGGATTPTYQTSDVVRARLKQQAAMQAELNPPKQGGAK